jgi:hypothetical protein
MAAIRFSQEELANALGLTRQRVGQLVKAQIIAKGDDGTFGTDAIRAYVAFIKSTSGETATDTLQSERMALTRIRRLIAEHQYAAVRAEYCSIEAAQLEIAEQFSIVRNRILGMGSKVAAQLVGRKDPNEIKAVIDEETTLALAELSAEDVVDVANRASVEDYNKDV